MGHSLEVSGFHGFRELLLSLFSVRIEVRISFLIRVQGGVLMFEFVLALARILVDIPCIVASGENADEISYLGLGGIERRYERLSEQEKHQVADCWQAFQSIVIRQNEVHRDAVRLNVELIRWFVRELENRDAGMNVEDPDEFDVLLDELVELARQMPGESLVELVRFARALVSVA
jgi:hypothetical protein